MENRESNILFLTDRYKYLILLFAYPNSPDSGVFLNKRITLLHTDRKLFRGNFLLVPSFLKDISLFFISYTNTNSFCKHAINGSGKQLMYDSWVIISIALFSILYA